MERTPEQIEQPSAFLIERDKVLSLEADLDHLREINAELLAALVGMMKLRAPDLITHTERAGAINAAVAAIAKARGEG